jgi:hypothetical protein
MLKLRLSRKNMGKYHGGWWWGGALLLLLVILYGIYPLYVRHLVVKNLSRGVLQQKNITSSVKYGSIGVRILSPWRKEICIRHLEILVMKQDDSSKGVSDANNLLRVQVKKMLYYSYLWGSRYHIHIPDGLRLVMKDQELVVQLQQHTFVTNFGLATKSVFGTLVDLQADKITITRATGELLANVLRSSLTINQESDGKLLLLTSADALMLKKGPTDQESNFEVELESSSQKTAAGARKFDIKNVTFNDISGNYSLTLAGEQQSDVGGIKTELQLGIINHKSLLQLLQDSHRDIVFPSKKMLLEVVQFLEMFPEHPTNTLYNKYYHFSIDHQRRKVELNGVNLEEFFQKFFLKGAAIKG